MVEFSFSRGNEGLATGEALYERRSLHRRRHFDSSRGVAKSFRPKDGSNDDGTNFHGQKRSKDTHESTTDPDARLYKKSYGKESHLAYLGHTLVENRNGLIAAAMITQADGYAEREAALLMLQGKQKGRSRRVTVGAVKAYDDGLYRGCTRVERHGACNE